MGAKIKECHLVPYCLLLTTLSIRDIVVYLLHNPKKCEYKISIKTKVRHSPFTGRSTSSLHLIGV